MAEKMRSWPKNARFARSLVVNVVEGAEGNFRDGDKYPEAVDELQIALSAPIRNHSDEGNYQYGIKAAAPRVLSLIKAQGVRATSLRLPSRWNVRRSWLSKSYQMGTRYAPMATAGSLSIK